MRNCQSEYQRINQNMEGKMRGQTLADVANGPSWILYVVGVIFALISMLLLSGRGAGLIAGYNTISKEEKEKYNEKMLCRIVGGGFSIITILIFAMATLEHVLPASFANIFGVITLVDVVIMIVLSNTVCKYKG